MAGPHSGIHAVRTKSKSMTSHDNADAFHIRSVEWKKPNRQKSARDPFQISFKTSPTGLWCWTLGQLLPQGREELAKAMRGLQSVGYKGTFSLLKIIKYLLGLVYFFICMLHFNRKIFKKTGTFLAVQWLRLCTSTAGGVGVIPGWGTKLSYTAWQKQNSLAQKHSHYTHNDPFLQNSLKKSLFL